MQAAQPVTVQASGFTANPELLQQLGRSMIPPAGRQLQPAPRKHTPTTRKKQSGLKIKLGLPPPPCTASISTASRSSSDQKLAAFRAAAESSESAASMSVAIGESNVGRGLLQKLGWKEGEALGKPSATGEGSGDRLLEPIKIVVRPAPSCWP